MEENNDLQNMDGETKIENQRNLNALDSEKITKCTESKSISGICTNALGAKEGDVKYVQHKDLMNCIAYEKCDDTKEDDGAWSEARYSDDFDSLSSDTTSDITDVSPQPLSPPPSSSGCSSMVKTETEVMCGKHIANKKLLNKEQKFDKRSSNSIHTIKNKETIKQEDQDEHTLQFLKDALHNLDCQSSGKTTISTVRTQFYPRQKNFTFNKEQMRNIDRENMILLRKIQSGRKKSKTDTYTTNYPRVSSSAVNRQKQQRRIEYENSILLQKIQRVKGTTNTVTGLRRF